MNNQKCFSQRTGKSITTYQSEVEALYEAKRTKERYNRDLVPYKCSNCGFWHLGLQTRHTPNEDCTSCGKKLYSSKESAERRKNIIAKEQRKELRIYKCPYSNGWHLTGNL